MAGARPLSGLCSVTGIEGGSLRRRHFGCRHSDRRNGLFRGFGGVDCAQYQWAADGYARVDVRCCRRMDDRSASSSRSGESTSANGLSSSVDGTLLSVIVARRQAANYLGSKRARVEKFRHQYPR
jgi:hypothetical protein